MIQIFSNSLGNDELEAVEKVFKSKWLGIGPECKSFEEELANHFGTPNVLLINNCTAGISLSLRALGVQTGDEVIISTANFVGIANAVIELGATPIFADVHPDYYYILPDEISRLKTKKTKAVYVLHYGGHPLPFDEIKEVCGDDIAILEDSANAVASQYRGKSCGTLGDAGVFSFDSMKTLVMGDGGALILKDVQALDRAKALRCHGFAPTTTSGVNAMKQGLKRWWEYDLVATSGRYISNDILSAIGRVQLRKLPTFIEKRKHIWDFYQKELKNLSSVVIPPEPLPDTTSSYYLYWLRIPKGRDELANYLREKGVYNTFRYFPLHMVKHYGSNATLPNAEKMNEITLNIPLHQNLSDDDTQLIVKTIMDFFKKYTQGGHKL
jgi:aminotransferase